MAQGQIPLLLAALLAFTSCTAVASSANNSVRLQITATYRFGWSGITAAEATVTSNPPGADGRTSLLANARTLGLARALWPMDAHLESESIGRGLSIQPIRALQTENSRGRILHTEIAFSKNEASRRRWKSPKESRPTDPKTIRIENLDTYESALWKIRQLPMAIGDCVQFRIYPDCNPYLVTLKLTRREHITVRAGAYPALRAEVKIERISPKNGLVAHSKVRQVTAWISDDPLRIPLRVEADIFVGQVFAELISVDSG